MNLSDLKEAKTHVTDLDCLVLTCEKLTAGNGNPYLSGVLTDAGASIKYKVWDNIPIMEPLLVPGRAVKITQGATDEFKGSISIKLVSVQLLSPEEAENLVPASYLSYETALERLTGELPEEILLYGLDIQPVLAALSKLNMLQTFLTAPAGVSKHHACRRGLITHCLEVTDLARSACVTMQADPAVKIDRGVLLTAALFHDVGKILEYTSNDIGLFTGFTSNGHLQGHSFMGAAMLSKMLSKSMADSTDRLVNLTHCIISHHGRPEWGAGVVPKTAEALILHHCDMLSSHTGSYSVEGAKLLGL